MEFTGPQIWGAEASGHEPRTTNHELTGRVGGMRMCDLLGEDGEKGSVEEEEEGEESRACVVERERQKVPEVTPPSRSESHSRHALENRSRRMSNPAGH